MRAFIVLAVYVVSVILIGGLLTPLVYHGIHALAATGIESSLFEKAQFRRVAHRTFMLVAVFGLWPMLRALRLKGRADWGYAIDWRRGLQSVGLGILFGLGTMSLLVAGLIALGIRTWDPVVGLGTLMSVVLSGVAAGLVISVIEETTFRGALFTAWSRGAGSASKVTPQVRLATAVICTAMAYAAVHFIKGNPPVPTIHWYSGFSVFFGSFEKFGEIDNIGPFVALVAVGVFLALARHYNGHIAWGIGVHAGWVAMIRGGKKITESVPDHPLIWLAPPSYDKITGPLAALYLIGMTALLVLWHRRRAGRTTAADDSAAPPPDRPT